MAIREVTMYRAVCDRCGKEHEDGEGLVAWTDAISAEEAAGNDEWTMQDDGRLLCSDCRWQPGGDLRQMAEEEGGEAVGWAIPEPDYIAKALTSEGGAEKPMRFVNFGDTMGGDPPDWDAMTSEEHRQFLAEQGGAEGEG